jgi:putative transport protein
VIELLVREPILLLLLVAAASYPLGRITLGGASLGLAAVLFVGLAFGALDPRLELPEFVYLFGLVVFVYTVGLTSGRGLVASLRRESLPEFALVAVVLVAAAGLTVLLARVLSLSPGVAAGVFAGGLTNTPALAAVLERTRHAAAAGGIADATIGYSLTYPIGVLGMLATLALLRRTFGVTGQSEGQRLASAGVLSPEPVTRSVRVSRCASTGTLLDALRAQHGWQVVFGRLSREAATHVITRETTVRNGDIITVVGAPAEVERVIAALGDESPDRIDWDRSALDYRRVFVSNPEVAGRSLAELDLPARFGAVVTRVRRGDVEMLARGDTVLELGDRVRVVTERTRLDAVSHYFGDSYRALSEVDILAFSVGPALGLALGLLSVPLPGGIDLRLGIAGGPLVVALVLGYLGRTGPVVWVLPYGANLTLRQIGLLLFLAAIGTRAGWEFRTLLSTGSGLTVVLAGAVLTCAVALAVIWFAYRVMRMPYALVGGVLAAVQTQPAVLGFALEQSRTDLPNLTYARLYPLALIAKILLAQVLYAVLAGWGS